MDIDPDIRIARLPPASFYADLHARVLARSWHLAPPLEPGVGQVAPFTFGEVPLVLARGEDEVVRCLSNVCTHRAYLVVQQKECVKSLRCRYHGRRFGLDGKFVSMPEFETALGFPSPTDDLQQAACGSLGPIVFFSLDPMAPLEEVLAPVRARAGSLPWDRLRFEGARDYRVASHWALYVENYLEGLHIPFVHGGLNRVIDYGSYETLTFEHATLQIARADQDAFPDGVAAYYFWLFPATMINVYPWGVSLNAVVPEGASSTRVTFLTWVWDEQKRERGAGADLHTVELEDEAVVEGVQRGVRSPLYERGRYSPTREIGVHHFHRLMARALG